MSARLRHLAINADDVQRARGFYEAVFGWTSEPWGPLNYQVRNAGDGFLSALQERRELKPGVRMLGFEATMAVDDIAATIAVVGAAGGKILRPAIYIEGVGRLIYFEDTEGNLVGAMQLRQGCVRLSVADAINAGLGDGFCVRSAATTYPDGWRLDRHDHPWGQLAFCHSGVMRVVSDAAAWLSPPTRAIWLPAGVAHEIVMKGEVASRFLYIAPELAAPLPGDPRVVEVVPLLRELILHILRIRMLDPTRAEHGRLGGLLIDLLVEARPLDLALPLPRDRRALALAERVQAAPAEPVSLADLARHAGASLRTLQRLFPAETGLTLEAWRQKARLIAGAALLSAGAPVTAAALDCGYDSPSAFITAFRRQFGVTPGRFRP